jgi:hypothetical protein
MKIVAELTAEELDLLKAKFVPPEQAAKLDGWEIDDGVFRGRYHGVAVEAELRVTPKG